MGAEGFSAKSYVARGIIVSIANCGRSCSYRGGSSADVHNRHVVGLERGVAVLDCIWYGELSEVVCSVSRRILVKRGCAVSAVFEKEWVHALVTTGKSVERAYRMHLTGKAVTASDSLMVGSHSAW